VNFFLSFFLTLLFATPSVYIVVIQSVTNTPVISGQNPMEKTLVGWREWVTLPDFAQVRLKAKLDTGAYSSALHATHLVESIHHGQKWVEFDIHPRQKSIAGKKRVFCPVLEFRHVKSSSGQTENRPVIRTRIKLAELIWDMEVTLTNRDLMGFRLLMGRKELKNFFLIDCNRSYIATSTKRKM
jgi:hypothetical protein